jgi:hypothetical protein
VDHLLRCVFHAAAFDVDGVGHGERHIHIGGATAVAGEFEAEAIGDGGNLHPFGDAAGAAVIGLNDIDGVAGHEFHETVLSVVVLAGGDAHVEAGGETGERVLSVRWEGLFQPEAAHLLVDAAAAEGLERSEALVGIDHQVTVLASEVAGHADAAHVAIERAVADLNLDAAEIFFEGGGDGAAEFGEIGVIIVIPAAHGVGGEAVAEGAEHLVDGESGGFAEDVPEGDIDGGEGETGESLHTLVFEGPPEIGTDALGEGGIFAGEDRLDFVLEKGLERARAARDEAEGTVGPAGDARVGEEADNHAAAVGAEALGGVELGLAGREAEEIGFKAGDFDLARQCGRCGDAAGETGNCCRGQKTPTVHWPRLYHWRER